MLKGVELKGAPLKVIVTYFFFKCTDAHYTGARRENSSKCFMCL